MPEYDEAELAAEEEVQKAADAEEQKAASTEVLPTIRQYTDLDDEELLTIQKTGEWPKGVGFKGMDLTGKYRNLFKCRDNKDSLLRELMKMKGVVRPKPTRQTKVAYESNIPEDIRRERLEIKKLELELKKDKNANMTEMHYRLIIIEKLLVKMTAILTIIKNDNEEVNLIVSETKQLLERR